MIVRFLTLHSIISNQHEANGNLRQLHLAERGKTQAIIKIISKAKALNIV